MFPIFQSAPWYVMPFQPNLHQITSHPQTFLNPYYVETGGIPLQTVSLFGA